MTIRTIPHVLTENGKLVDFSPGFDESLTADVERIAIEIGEPPAESMTVTWLNRSWVAIVSTRGTSSRFLVLNRKLYEAIPSPFAIVDRFPPEYVRGGPRPDLEWPPEPLPRRKAADLEAVLKHGDSPFLLGASQALVDSGRIALVRDLPDEKTIRDLWALLPDSIRRQTTFATFAGSTAFAPSIVVLRSLPEGGIAGYLTEDQARDYPESRYERELQVAIEHGDQKSLDKLLARRSSSETLRLALWMVALAFLFALTMKVLNR